MTRVDTMNQRKADLGNEGLELAADLDARRHEGMQLRAVARSLKRDLVYERVKAGHARVLGLRRRLREKAAGQG